MTSLRRLTLSILFAFSAHAASPVYADGQRIESPAHRVSLVELFTSEGCSSCPPADRWMSELKNDERIWERMVPVAFHVDYWDYIGWPDRFARKAFGERQRNYARTGNVASVYTPGFVVHGEEWRGWFRYPTLDLTSPPPAGILRLDIAADGATVKANYIAAATSPEPLDLHLAVLGFDISTPVKAGENEGRTLEHDFVVLGYSTAPMDGGSPKFNVSTSMPKARVKAPRRALAAWVSPRGEQKPLQAAGGWLK